MGCRMAVIFGGSDTVDCIVDDCQYVGDSPENYQTFEGQWTDCSPDEFKRRANASVKADGVSMGPSNETIASAQTLD